MLFRIRFGDVTSAFPDDESQFDYLNPREPGNYIGKFESHLRDER